MGGVLQPLTQHCRPDNSQKKLLSLPMADLHTCE